MCIHWHESPIADYLKYFFDIILCYSPFPSILLIYRLKLHLYAAIIWNKRFFELLIALNINYTR